MDENEKRACEPIQIPTVVKDIKSCIETLGKTQQCFYRPQYEDVIKQGRFQLLNIIQKIKEHECRKSSLASKEDIERDIFMTEMETEFEETKVAHLRKEWSQQQQTMAKLQECLYKKCRLLSLHSSYCSSQGSALGAILAVLMKNEELVELYLAEPDTYLISFIKIADGCLFSFVKTYAYDVPLEDSADYRYVLALYACISHISTLTTGRQFLIKREECQNMLTELIYVLPYIKHTTAQTLKITLLKILHDVKEEEEGLNFLRRCANLPATLNSCIINEYNAEEHKYTLEILECITKQIPNKELLDKLTNTINTERLKELSNHKYREVNLIPRKIFENIRIAADKFRMQQEAEADVPRSQSTSRICKCKSNQVSKRRSAPAPTRIQTRQLMRLPRDHSGARIRVAQKFKPTGDGYISPQSSSSQSSAEADQTASSAGSLLQPEYPYEPPALCATPCRELFQLEGTQPDFVQNQVPRYPYGEQAAPYRNPCLSSCTGPCRAQEKPPVPPFGSSVYRRSSQSKKRTSRPPSRKRSSSSREPSTDRLHSGDRSSPCRRKSSSNKPSSHRKSSSSGKKPSAGDTSLQSSKTKKPCTSDIPCKDLLKTQEKKSKTCGSRRTHSLPIKAPCGSACSGSCKSKKKKSASLPSSRSPSASSQKSCSCVSSKSKSVTKPKPKESTASESKRKFSCEEPKPTSASSDLPYKKPAYTTSKRRSWCADSKHNRISSKSKLEPLSCLKQTKSSSAKSKPIVCISAAPQIASTDHYDYIDTTNLPSTSTAQENSCFCTYTDATNLPSTFTAQENSCFCTYTDRTNLPSTSTAKDNSYFCTLSFDPITALPVSHDVEDISLSISSNEEEICTCGSASEKQLVPWSPEDRMVARLSQFDRRVYHHVQNSIRIISRLGSRVPNKSQRVVTRIKIPGLPFKRLKDSYQARD